MYIYISNAYTAVVFLSSPPYSSLSKLFSNSPSVRNSKSLLSNVRKTHQDTKF